MADKKISQLTSASTPVAGTEVLPVVQGGSTVKVSIDNLTAGKSVSASAFTSTGDSSFNSVSVGRGAANVTTNTAVGTSALGANQAGGTNNTAVGYQALDANTTGDQNTAVGEAALGAASTGSGNTAIGYGAGSAITTGSKNVVVGGYSGNSGGFDIRTSSNIVALSDGDGNLMEVLNGANTVFFAPQVNVQLQRFTKTISLNANATTDLITFTQTSYQMNVFGNFQIFFVDAGYPNGCISQLSNAAATTTTGAGSVTNTYNVINAAQAQVGTISLTFAAATSKTVSVQDGIFKLTGATNADTSGTCVIIFTGIINGCTVS
jgi:hypothetical protein